MNAIATTTPVLADDDLRRIAPSIFAVAPWERMSARYKMVPTIEVVGMLAGEGFHPVRAAQSRTRIECKGDFTKHLIRFRHATHLDPIRVGDEVPELILTNSHDGSAAYRFMSGIFRLVCSNGLTVQSADFGSVSVRHSGGAGFERQILDATREVIADAPRTLEKIETWKQIELAPKQREAFAAAVLELRDSKAIEPAQLLTTRRPEDAKPDLWTTANVLQENTMKGGLRGRAETGRRVTTRPVKSVGEDVRMNRALWVLTERLAEIVK
jgi:Domain of unknown function (DUF932)